MEHSKSLSTSRGDTLYFQQVTRFYQHYLFVPVRRAEGERVQEVRQEQPLPSVLLRRPGAVPPLRPPLRRRRPDHEGIRMEGG